MRWLPVTMIGRGRRRAEDTARQHLEQSVSEREEVERVTGPLRRAERQNHLAARIERSLRGHS